MSKNQTDWKTQLELIRNQIDEKSPEEDKDIFGYPLSDHYRLYVRYVIGGYKLKGLKDKLPALFGYLDAMIIQGKDSGQCYMIVERKDGGDMPIFLNYGNVEEYIAFKERVKEESQQKRLERINKG